MGVIFGSFAMMGSQKSCQSSYVNGAKALVGDNLVALSLLVAILPWSNFGRNSFQILCTGGIIVVTWRRQVNAMCGCEKILWLMEVVSAAFPVCVMACMPGNWRVHG
jgi:hypothetical protein